MSRLMASSTTETLVGFLDHYLTRDSIENPMIGRVGAQDTPGSEDIAWEPLSRFHDGEWPQHNQFIPFDMHPLKQVDLM